MRLTRFGAAPLLVALLTACASAQTGPITGVAVDEAGTPLPGAEIALIGPRDYQTREYPILSRAQTDAAGRFSLPATPSAPTRTLPQFVIAFTEGRSLTWRVLRSKDDIAPIRFVLGPAPLVRGQVIDTHGDPIPGVEITARGAYAIPRDGIRGTHCPMSGAALAAPATVPCNAAGEFAYHYMPREASVEFEICAPGYTTLRGHLINEGEVWRWQRGLLGEAIVDPDALEITLEDASYIAGTVFLPDGKPASGIRVYTTGPEQARNASTLSGEDGSYRLGPIVPGKYTVQVRAEDYVVAHRRVEGLTEGQTLGGIDFRLSEGALIEGKVIDASTGKPIERTSLTARMDAERMPNLASSDWWLATTDKEGQYRLRVLPGSIRLTTGPRGEREEYVRQAPRALTVAEGQTVTADFSLQPRWSMPRLLVVDEAGKPVPGAALRCPDVWPSKQTTGEEGALVTDRLADPGHAVWLVAVHEARKIGALVSLMPQRPGAKQETVTITLKPCVSVEGQALTWEHKGAPAVEYSVSVVLFDGPKGEDWMGFGGDGGQGYERPDGTRVRESVEIGGGVTDDDGRFFFGLCIPGITHRLQLQKKEPQSRLASLREDVGDMRIIEWRDGSLTVHYEEKFTPGVDSGLIIETK